MRICSFFFFTVLLLIFRYFSQVIISHLWNDENFIWNFRGKNIYFLLSLHLFFWMMHLLLLLLLLYFTVFADKYDLDHRFKYLSPPGLETWIVFFITFSSYTYLIFLVLVCKKFYSIIWKTIFIQITHLNDSYTL